MFGIHIYISVFRRQVALADECRQSDASLENVLLETQRMWPPFIGGRRLATRDCKLDGMKVSKGQALVFMTYHAHRDEKVFQNPDQFNHERWNGSNMSDRARLFTFGAGSRCCLGRHLVDYLLKVSFITCPKSSNFKSFDFVIFLTLNRQFPKNCSSSLIGRFAITSQISLTSGFRLRAHDMTSQFVCDHVETRSDIYFRFLCIIATIFLPLLICKHKLLILERPINEKLFLLLYFRNLCLTYIL